MSLALLFHYLLLNMFQMLVHPSSGACNLLWIYFICCISLVRCVLVLRCGSAGWCDILMQAEALKCSILLIEMSSKSCGFMKCQPRCLSLNVARASLSQWKLEAVSDASLHPTHLGLFPRPNSNTFKWQCSISNPVLIFRRFRFKLSNSSAFLTVF